MKEDLFSAFKLAIEKEQEAYEFYTYLSGQTDDMELKEVLLLFAREESSHREKLMKFYEKMRQKEAPGR